MNQGTRYLAIRVCTLSLQMPTCHQQDHVGNVTGYRDECVQNLNFNEPTKTHKIILPLLDYKLRTCCAGHHQAYTSRDRPRVSCRISIDIHSSVHTHVQECTLIGMLVMGGSFNGLAI